MTCTPVIERVTGRAACRQTGDDDANTIITKHANGRRLKHSQFVNSKEVACNIYNCLAKDNTFVTSVTSRLLRAY